MPVLEGRHDGRQIIVDVLVAEPSFRRSLRTLAGRGLIDTGASASLITRGFAESLSLPLHAKRPLVSARSTDMVNRYAFKLGFLLSNASSIRRPYIHDAELVGSEFVDHANFDVIVGMDVLRTGELILRRDRTFTFSF